MDCPRCQKTMIRGSVHLGQSLPGALIAGLALPHLYFGSPDSGSVSVLDWASDESAAHRCTECGVVVLQGKRDS